ncbi:hypothetical protein Thi970DRAFT_00276 [Thiorhodovibrio frisius]|uniref:Uncharacterized protein n=1 Tax=Thiorhodovibrio frisius TaxID=631362 RepID=H8YVX4_9GAMM|nr:hypothetical protein Thi970DRAFT_00276 [Thiorhodovibrio frisius]WPL20179.1 hypothetical protein Thiofri_00247 [Thiorhodovibrio frisius]
MSWKVLPAFSERGLAKIAEQPAWFPTPAVVRERLGLRAGNAELQPGAAVTVLPLNKRKYVIG